MDVDWTAKMNGALQIMLLAWNLLIIPGIVYVVKLEKRLARIDETLKTLCKEKPVIFGE